MTESIIKMAKESLERAINNQSLANYETIINGFMDMGIPEADIIPRVNVFTFNAWKALNRVVKKGEKGIRVITCIPCTKKDKETGEEVKVTKTKTTTVFHVTQTQPIDETEDKASAEPAPELEERRQHYADKLAAKQERYESLSANAQTKGHALHSKAHQMAEAIPFGQPILIGHHSEKRDRRYRDRIHSTFGKAFEELSKAEYYEKKAATVGTGGISSDDPDAITKLKQKLEGMQKNQDLMKNCNKVIRKFKNKESQVAELVKLGISQANAEKLLEGDFCGRIGFAPYALQNNNANMGRVKERIAELEKTQNLSAQAEEYESFSYEVDSLDNRIVFTFPGKPDEETRKILKSHSFHFSPTRSPKGSSVWVRKVTLNALHDARRVKEQLLK